LDLKQRTPLVVQKIKKKFLNKKKEEKEKMQVCTINLPEAYVGALMVLTDSKIFPSRSEAIRQALAKFLERELEHLQDLGELETLMEGV